MTTQINALHQNVSEYSVAKVSPSPQQNVGATNSLARIAIDAPVTLSGIQTIQGITLVENDVVLVTAQADAKTNGLYRIPVSGAWARQGTLFPGMLVSALLGTYADSVWYLAQTGGIILGTTSITFTKISSGASRWTITTGWTAAPASASQITFTSTTGRSAGEPIRYRTAAGGSTYFYAIIFNVSAGSLDIKGPSLSGQTITGIWIGNKELVVQANLMVQFLYAFTSQDILANVSHEYFRWLFGQAALVMFSARHNTAGLGTAKINMKVNGNLVETVGVLPNTTGVDSIFVSAANYLSSFGNYIEIACVATDAQARDLSVTAVFVLA